MKINYPQRVNFPLCLDVNLFEIYNENKLPPKSKVYNDLEIGLVTVIMSIHQTLGIILNLNIQVSYNDY